MKRAFVVDFDGTITVKDVGFSIVKELAEDGWKELGDLWIERKINTAKCGQKQWDLLKKNDDDIKKFAGKFQINAGFKEFIDKIKENQWEMTITSDGYDIYIKEILDKNGFSDLKLCCNRAVYKNGWNLYFENEDSICGFCGNCKKRVVDKFKNAGYEVYYIGDGHSDICACINADLIFAKSFLKDYCEREQIPYYPFDNFFDILKYIK